MKRFLMVFLFILMGISFLTNFSLGQGIPRSQVLLEIATTIPSG